MRRRTCPPEAEPVEVAHPAALGNGDDGVLEAAGGGQEALPELGGSDSRELLDVGVPGLLRGVHRDVLALLDPGQDAGQCLGVQGQVCDHVGA